jgi:hypothetical protein
VANKASFTPSEWTTLLESVMMAGMAVTVAEPSGLWGLMKEGLASGWALLEAKNSGANELIKAVAADFGTSEGRTAARDGVQAKLSGNKLPEVKSKAIATLREAAALLDAKAQKAAEASTEGGFLGFGGVQVSDAEKATLAEISSALRIPA